MLIIYLLLCREFHSTLLLIFFFLITPVTTKHHLHSFIDTNVYLIFVKIVLALQSVFPKRIELFLKFHIFITFPMRLLTPRYSGSFDLPTPPPLTLHSILKNLTSALNAILIMVLTAKGNYIEGEGIRQINIIILYFNTVIEL